MAALNKPQDLFELLPGQIWTKLYYIRLAGATFSARTTVVKLSSGGLWVHSPGPLDQSTKEQVNAQGTVEHIVAPGDYHHMFVPHWVLAYPDAKVHICPGLDVKRKDIKYDTILSDTPDGAWAEDFHQVLIQGRVLSEVIFLHRPSRTLIVTDMVEYITDRCIQEHGLSQDWGTWLWTNLLMMKNRPLPAPEYRAGGFPDPGGVSRALAKIVREWQPERVILAHGENIEGQQLVNTSLKQCWAKLILDLDMAKPIPGATPPAAEQQK